MLVTNVINTRPPKFIVHVIIMLVDISRAWLPLCQSDNQSSVCFIFSNYIFNIHPQAGTYVSWFISVKFVKNGYRAGD